MTDDQPTIAASDAESHDSAEDEFDLTGQLLSGRYRVEECLGEGAMGAVYRAEHTLMKKTVAVKVLRPQVGERGDLVERFRREAQAAANIDHPNVCSASDFGQMQDGAFFLVIEYLEGDTLEDVVAREGPLPAGRALSIAAQICAALARAHELDVVHRDLKPENVMLVPRDEDDELVKILDFGVAKVRLTDEHEESKLTKAGTVWGTPCYMSPEQAAGGDVDGRSDLYSLGVMLYEMLTGAPPFEDDNPARVMAMHLTEKPVPPSEAAPDAAIPPPVERLVMQLLEKDPAARPPSAAALRDRLDEAARAGSSTTLRVRQAADKGARTLGDAVDAARPLAERLLGWFDAQSTLTQGIAVGASAAILLGLLAVPVLIVGGLGGGAQTAEEQQEIQRNLAKERAQYLKSAGLDDLPVALEENRTTDALDMLDGLDEKQRTNAHVAYMRGRVNGVRGRWQASMEGYGDALDAEPLYADDPELIDDVFERFSDRSDHRADEARRLIEGEMDTPIVTRRLAKLAKFGDRSEVRDRALDVLRKTGRLSDLEDWNRLGVELRHATDCDKRKELIADMVDEADPRGLDILEYLDERSGHGCGFLGLEDCYGCIRDELREAIKTLEDEAS